MRNEEGFILPVTIAISFLFFMVFSFQLNMYLTEKNVSKETEEIHVLENLMQLGVSDITKLLRQDVTPIQRTGTERRYPSGTTSFSVTPVTISTSKVLITCVTNNLRIYKAEILYDYETQTIVKWLEYR
ncbi:competence type IV pilus minor pilin ComGG [Fredinandcohnia sp. 179-A 10B2 NHS]|uniref:competence type IV pilus minor pilin ComGG n=1 Tax=Fredinandcohnia sp. 179-A 10B2 NHS TaxID=3235176 RepID=UPI0039A0E9AA